MFLENHFILRGLLWKRSDYKNKMACYYEEENGKRNFYIVLLQSEINRLNSQQVSLGGLTKRITEEELRVFTFLSLGKTKFAEIDRKYSPILGLPLKETKEIEFILRDSLFAELKRKGSLVSELPNGTVNLQIGETEF